MSSKLDLFREDIRIGDEVVLDLTTKRVVRGRVTEITEVYVKLATSQGTSSRFFEEMLGSWEVIKSPDHSTREKSGDNEGVQALTSLPLTPVLTPPQPGLSPIGPMHPISPIDAPPESLGPVTLDPSASATDDSPTKTQQDNSNPASFDSIEKHVPTSTALEILPALYKIEAQLEARMATARLDLRPPSFEFTDKDVPSLRSGPSRQLWDRVGRRRA